MEAVNSTRQCHEDSIELVRSINKLSTDAKVWLNELSAGGAKDTLNDYESLASFHRKSLKIEDATKFVKSFLNFAPIPTKLSYVSIYEAVRSLRKRTNRSYTLQGLFTALMTDVAGSINPLQSTYMFLVQGIKIQSKLHLLET
jgi:hypothetical protein